ncbi:hypothetical protein H2204_006822 [Knufia peltigerae]|uniref:1-alkyl-2-acetylglycerophosphocholine esterase n=1 Tax=Knufia peltigerae TaxID=1002370 RepID=A0AA38Y2W5_9EURO|nr:hypothetical protein H2204_006822 [Knufia peltigerae]
MVSFIQAAVASMLLKACLAFNATIPPPKGPFGVASTTAELINAKMLDPYSPTKQERRLMVSAFYPLAEVDDCQQTKVPYMSAGTAAFYDQQYSAVGLPNGTFEAIQLTLCRNTALYGPSKNTYPLAIFSPGLGDSRLLYSNIAASLAAQGYVVVTVDHPYDADVVEFPSGDLVMAANINDSDVNQLDAALAVRVKDLSFVIDQMRNRTLTRGLFKNLYGKVNPTKALVFGHSFGGAAAASIMSQDHRAIGGVNLDGTFFGSVVSGGLDRPFMIFAHEGKNQSTDPSWATAWPHLKDSKVQTSVIGSAHGSFLDFPVIIDTLGLRPQLPPQLLSELIGTVKGDRMLTILTTYISAFFDFVLGYAPSPLLQHGSPAFPEVIIVNSTLFEKSR